uniref:Uncharacterized protein n=1 Tax=Arundo donax TaxID=35708 RepID=A0A0A8YBK1_ARUDO
MNKSNTDKQIRNLGSCTPKCGSLPKTSYGMLSPIVEHQAFDGMPVRDRS